MPLASEVENDIEVEEVHVTSEEDDDNSDDEEGDTNTFT